MLESMDIADYFVLSSLKQNIEINNLKLQKLLYYFYAMNLVNGNENPFHEKFEKWQYGPVLPSVYHSYKQFGGYDIVEVPKHFRFNSQKDEFESYQFDESILSENIRESIDAFIRNLSNYGPFDLVEKTHSHDEWKKDEPLINMGIKNLEYDDVATKEFFKDNPEEQIWTSQS
ncbi:Panacea domain-containing protein [Lactococcus cremoris]|uniref:Panacea domain-containing protein n=1 Tax=Lactococcus lactis subsp. cremoris TaxID=1359 RepID=UPI0007AE8852|nr:type II toxin-antitoxin system antitoxin SocA domain-containing protein [Lactococcus cremoris]KZK08682.1 Phage protein [Lactococcus cremoris]MCT0504548.1 DUF4065 domain-containing protein [Lactococcus cremoris]MDU8932103.1 hypothetical protein [Lactococcus cremoris]